MKSQKIIIAVLVTSALVLSVLLILMPQHPQVANAAMNAVGRDYTLLTSEQPGGGSDEYINVVDTRNNRIILYAIQKDRLVALNGRDLNGLFVPTAPIAPR